MHGQSFDLLRIVESILSAAFEFPDAASFMEFVEQALATSSLDTPMCDSEVQTKYSMFLKLKFSMNESKEEIERIVFESLDSLMQISEIKRRFQSNHEKRFLMHLILHHHFALTSNGSLFQEIDMINHEEYPEVSGISVFQALVRQSCFPNASFKRYENQMFVFVMRPVKKGEQLVIEDGRGEPSKGCHCSKCTCEWKHKWELSQLEAEDDYYILKLAKTDDYKDDEKRPILKAKLVPLLKKYGRLPWSPELQCLLFSFNHCMAYEFQS